MGCPTLSELPPPPPGNTGWPWTEESPQLPDTMPNGPPWPRVSIVTPSYNQGEFIEETIRSVLLQGYPDLEYIIMDGGSTDNSVEIIRKYQPWLAYWVSEPDEGQADAINKGFRMTKGEILTWLNSDDIYVSNSAISQIVDLFHKYPKVEAITGGGVLIDENGHWTQPIKVQGSYICYKHLRYRNTILQPATFFKRRVFEELGLDQSLAYAFDWDFFIRVSQRFNVLPVNWIIAGYRMHGRNKTAAGGAKRARELLEVTRRYLGKGTWQYYVVLVFYELYLLGEKLPEQVRVQFLKVIRQMSNVISIISFKRVTSV